MIPLTNMFVGIYWNDHVISEHIVTPQNVIMQKNVNSAAKCNNNYCYILLTNWTCAKCNKAAARCNNIVQNDLFEHHQFVSILYYIRLHLL